MKNEKILDALEHIDEELIEQAAPGNKPPKKAKNMVWMKWVAMAACALVIVGIGVPYVLGGNDGSADNAAVEDFSAESSNEDTTSNTTATTETLEKEDADITYVADEGFPNWGLTLSVKDVTDFGLTLVCTQSGGELTGELQTGSDYKLIVLKEAWEDVPTIIEEYGWNMLAYMVAKDDVTEFEINWEWLYGKLPAGTYRLVKGFMEFRETGDYDDFPYWVEFQIK